ncbi:hypothetical protein P3T37_004933 [Kitasatospora sp. MAA4]|nr:hypothetical protein [Kitasatospora sp. MAA4]
MSRWRQTRSCIRDSKDKAGPVLTFAPAAWSAFVRSVALGEG